MNGCKIKVYTYQFLSFWNVSFYVIKYTNVGLPLLTITNIRRITQLVHKGFLL